MSILGKIEIKRGKIVKDVTNITTNPRIIIFPKSITGLMSENIRDPKATIVVKAV